MTGSRTTGLLAAIRALQDDPHRPRLVWHTAEGARTELSGASLANWTAKVAGLLRDDVGLAPGDVVSVPARAGWQVAPVLLGCWWAGLCVTGDHDAAAVAFVDQGADADADEVFVLSGHPLGAPATDVADHQRDFTTAALPQSDRLGSPATSGEKWDAARVSGRPVTAARLMLAAAAIGDQLGGEGIRATGGSGAEPPDGSDPGRPVLLSTVPWTVPDGVARTLLAALAAGGSLVQCPTGWPADTAAKIARVERATAAIGVDIPGMVRVVG